MERSGGRVALDIPNQRPEQNLQLLAFFGHKVFLLPQPYFGGSYGQSVDGLMQLFPPAPFPALAPWPIVSGPSVKSAAWTKSFAVLARRRRQGIESTWAAGGSLTSPEGRGYTNDIGQRLEQYDNIMLRQQERQLLVSSGHTRFTPGGILRGPGEKKAGNSLAFGGEGGISIEKVTIPTLSLLGDETSTDMTAPFPREVWMTWEEEGGALSSGCSLFDNNDTELIQEIMAESMLSLPVR